MVRNRKVYFHERRKSAMAKIICYEECKAKCLGYPRCTYSECEGANKEACFKCLNRCPCCAGHIEGFCDQCSEDCDNRNKPYDPEAISKEG